MTSTGIVRRRLAALLDLAAPSRTLASGRHVLGFGELRRTLGPVGCSRSRASSARTSRIAVRAVSADDLERLLGARRVGPDLVPGTVRLRRDHRPRVGDDVVHVRRDAGTLLLLLVQLLEATALDCRDRGVDPGLDALAPLPAQDTRDPATAGDDGGQGGGGQGGVDARWRADQSVEGGPDGGDHDRDQHAGQTEPAYSTRPVRAQGEEEREVDEVSDQRELRGEQLGDGGGDGRHDHDRDRQAPHRQGDSEQQGSEGAGRGEAELDGADREGEQGGDADVEDDPAALGRAGGVVPYVVRESRDVGGRHGPSIPTSPEWTTTKHHTFRSLIATRSYDVPGPVGREGLLHLGAHHAPQAEGQRQDQPDGCR